MTTEQQLKARCTNNDIKHMAILAEGFNHPGECIFIETPYKIISLRDIVNNKTEFPLLIRRAVDGWNEKQNDSILILDDRTKALPNKDYQFKNYQKENLTLVECACLHCLLDRFEEERKCNVDAVKQK